MKLENSSKTYMRLNNILILGNGYVGNILHNHLKNEFNCVIKSSKDLNYHDSKTLYKYSLNNDIDTIINCSGFTGRPNIDEAEVKKEICWELNVESPLRVNKVCDLLNIKYIHISSGCIYDGYEKKWSENDPSNYGLFQNHSSFYSKTKHAFEILSKENKGVVLRIRMPFTYDASHRNYLTKIRSYNNLINFKNSKTYIPDLCKFIENLLIKKSNFWHDRQTYNVVNPEPLTTDEVCEIMKKYGFHNNNWKFVNLSDLPIITSRSNCILNDEKSKQIYSLKSEREVLEECLQTMINSTKEYNKKYDEIQEQYKI